MATASMARRGRAANGLLLSVRLGVGPAGCGQIIGSAISIPFGVARTAATKAAKISFEATEAGARGVVAAIVP